MTAYQKNNLSRNMAKGVYDGLARMEKEERVIALEEAERHKIRDSFEVLTPPYRRPTQSDEEIAAMPRQQSPNNCGREHKIRLLQTVYAQGSTRSFKKARREMKDDYKFYPVTTKPGTPKFNYLVRRKLDHIRNDAGEIVQFTSGTPHLDYKRQKRKVDRRSINDLFVDEALEEWTHPAFGNDWVE